MRCYNLDSSPQIGRLIMEYLLEEQRHYTDEFKRCCDDARETLDDPISRYQRRDEVYVSRRLSPRELRADLDFVRSHWNRRHSYISAKNNLKFDLIQMIKDKATKKPWKNIYDNESGNRLITPELGQDIQTALEYENLFCHARMSGQKSITCSRTDTCVQCAVTS
ncbi:hypothetical protein MRB53_041673 [Persea americana]|nr:hypothetical protein MRB53_041673 [Persea americana]